MSSSLTERMQTSDRIILEDLAFYGYHGVMLEESKVGCRFRIDVECGVDLSHAAKTDEVDDTISYELIFNQVQESFFASRYKLLEALAQRMIDDLFDNFSTIDWIKMRVAKPEAPIPVVKGEFAIQLVRARD